MTDEAKENSVFGIMYSYFISLSLDVFAYSICFFLHRASVLCELQMANGVANY